MKIDFNGHYNTLCYFRYFVMCFFFKIFNIVILNRVPGNVSSNKQVGRHKIAISPIRNIDFDNYILWINCNKGLCSFFKFYDISFCDNHSNGV